MSTMFKRGMTATFDGAFAPSGREANGYSIDVFGRRERRIVLVLHTSRLSEAFQIARALIERFPDRLVMVSREQYGGKWVTPDYRLPGCAPDYRAACIGRLTMWRRRGRAWRELAGPPRPLIASVTGRL